MASRNDDTKTTLLLLLLVIWFVVFAYSLAHLLRAQDVVATTQAGSQRTIGFLGWQGVAGMVAVGCWGIGWSYPTGSGIRRISALPITVTCAMILVIGAMVAFG